MDDLSLFKESWLNVIAVGARTTHIIIKIRMFVLYYDMIPDAAAVTQKKKKRSRLI